MNAGMQYPLPIHYWYMWLFHIVPVYRSTNARYSSIVGNEQMCVCVRVQWLLLIQDVRGVGLNTLRIGSLYRMLM